MRLKLPVILFALSITGLILPLVAHHSVASQYDTNKIVTIRGVVTRSEWTNPHTRFWIDVKNDDTAVSSWEMELLPPNTLKRQGVKQDFIKQGDPVTVEVWTAKDGSKFAHPLMLTLPDGQVMRFPRDLLWMGASSK